MDLDSSVSPGKLAVLVVGTDAIIEALPARPVQLANACGVLGFDLVVPLSWGDELVAEAALHAVNRRSSAPAVLCACPVVRDRLIDRNGEGLGHAAVGLESPPAAVARFLRSQFGDRLGELTFAGRCPGARYPDYDRVIEPSDLLRQMRVAGIDVALQPDVFADRLPADRRRFFSLPGGCPEPDVLWRTCNERLLVEVDGPDTSIEIAQLLLSPRSVLVDAAAAMGCSCSGVTHATRWPTSRIAATSLEPPRSPTPILADSPRMDLEVPLSAGSDRSTHLPVITYGRQRMERPPMAVTPPSALLVR